MPQALACNFGYLFLARSLEGWINEKSATALMTSLAIVAATNSAGGESAQPYTPGLVEFMMTVQSHHSKLWLAANARNWELADYQVDELKELLEDIAKRVPDYKGTPVGKMIEAVSMPPISDVERCYQEPRQREIHGRLRPAHSGLQCVS